jgi:sortase B
MCQKKKNALVVSLLVVLLCLGCYAIYQLYLSYNAYNEGDQIYEQIIQQVISDDASSEQTSNKLEIPNRTVDFNALKAISENSIGWLYCPDTVIDYPVMAGDDYTYYLHHLPDGTYNINGSLFLDYECATDFSDKLSVIYGHNMKTEKMFGTLVKYKNQSYFDKHPYLYLYTQTQNYRIDLIYGAVVSADEWSEKNFVQDIDGLIEYAKENTTFISSVEYTNNQQLIVLSTCSYEFNDARYFVIGVLQSE